MKKSHLFKLIKRLTFIAVVIILIYPSYLTKISGAEEIEDLFVIYGEKERGEGQGLILQKNLLEKAPKNMSQYDMWRSLFEEDVTEEERAALALKLIDEIYPQGNPAKWDEIGGLWIPQLVPKPLAAFDALYVAVGSLLSLNNEGAAWLARSLLLQLYESRGARIYGIRTAPIEVVDIIEKLKVRAPLPPIGGWPNPKVLGRLPYARKIYGYISVDTALVHEMTFLDSLGRPRGGSGVYAWDRARGRIYNVKGGRNEDEIWPNF
jgi:hypothetical protein